MTGARRQLTVRQVDEILTVWRDGQRRVAVGLHAAVGLDRLESVEPSESYVGRAAESHIQPAVPV